MSGGNEGELPIQLDSIYVRGYSLRIPPPLPPQPPGVMDRNDSAFHLEYYRKEVFCIKHCKVYGEDYWGKPFSKKEFISSVKKIRECFDYDYGEYNSIINGRIICPAKHEKINMKKDKLYRWTYQELINN